MFFFVLGIPGVVVQDIFVREAASRELFQARKLILLKWISQSSPTSQMWIDYMGVLLRYERLIYQHRGNPSKF